MELTLEADLEDSVATCMGHLFGLECGWQENLLLILLLVPLRPDVEDVVVNLDRQIIRSDSRQLDDHGHMIGLLKDVHRRFNDLVDRGPPGLLVRPYVAERFHLQPRASFRPSDTGPDREPIDAFQLILAELLESLEFPALLGKFSEFLDQVGKAVQETAAEINLFTGWLTLLRRFGHRVIVSFQKDSCAGQRSAPTTSAHSRTIERRSPEWNAPTVQFARQSRCSGKPKPLLYRPIRAAQAGHGDLGGESPLQGVHETEKETADLTRGKGLIDPAGDKCIAAIEQITAQRLDIGLETLYSSGSIEQQLTVQFVFLDQQIGGFRADQPGTPGHQFHQ